MSDCDNEDENGNHDNAVSSDSENGAIGGETKKSPRSIRSRIKEMLSPKKKDNKYSDGVKQYLKNNNIESVERLTKEHIKHLKGTYSIKAHQVKRYFFLGQ